MNSPQFLDDPISVEAHLSGKLLYPEALDWRGQTYAVVSVGRQWTEDNAPHVLIELHDGCRMEIKLLADLSWRLCSYWPPVYVV